MKEPEYKAEQFDLFKPPKGSAIKSQVRAPFHVSKEQSSVFDRRMSGPPPKERYTIYTDGACHPNPGIGAWCAIVLRGGKKIAVLVGRESETTNNRAELCGIITALEWLRESDGATILSDSQYCVQGCNTWRHSWARRGWTLGSKKNRGQPVLNSDLWKRIHELCRTRFVDFKWVRGHNGDRWNEECDQIAVAVKEGRYGEGDQDQTRKELDSRS